MKPVRAVVSARAFAAARRSRGLPGTSGLGRGRSGRLRKGPDRQGGGGPRKRGRRRVAGRAPGRSPGRSRRTGPWPRSGFLGGCAGWCWMRSCTGWARGLRRACRRYAPAHTTRHSRWDILAYLVDTGTWTSKPSARTTKRTLHESCLHGTPGLRAVPADPGGRRRLPGRPAGKWWALQRPPPFPADLTFPLLVQPPHHCLSNLQEHHCSPGFPYRTSLLSL